MANAQPTAGRHGRCWRLVIIAAAVMCANPQSQSQAAAPSLVETCELDPGPLRTVTRILDSETLVLDDGREVRLIGALGARAGEAAAATGAWPPETYALETLTRLTLGKTVQLAFGGRRTDRYGRHLSHVFVQSNGASGWVQGAMLVAGAARAYALTGSVHCMAEMMAHERIAREAKRGLWSNGTYRLKPAGRPGYLMSLRNRFERITGTVQSVSRTKSALYLNFGTDWKTDFTARVGLSTLAAKPDWGSVLDAMKGKRIIVRGWIERRNGPMIDVIDPAQIEMFDGGGTAPEPGLSSSSGGLAAPAAGGDADRGDADGGDADRGQNEKRPDPLIENPGATDL